MAKTFLLASLLVCASALQAPMTKSVAPAAAAKAAPVKLFSKVAAAAAAFTPYAAMAQSEGTGLMFGIDDQRLQYALILGYGLMFSVYFNWAKDQPDSDSDFFGASSCLVDDGADRHFRVPRRRVRRAPQLDALRPLPGIVPCVSTPVEGAPSPRRN